MSKLVQFDFKFQGPFGDELTKAMEGLARSINEEPGFIWKIWTENSHTGQAGGIYVFSDEPAARAYVETYRAAQGLRHYRGERQAFRYK